MRFAGIFRKSPAGAGIFMKFPARLRAGIFCKLPCPQGNFTRKSPVKIPRFQAVWAFWFENHPYPTSKIFPSRLLLKSGQKLAKIGIFQKNLKIYIKAFQNPYRSLKSAQNSISYSGLKFGRIFVVFHPGPQKPAMLARFNCRVDGLGDVQMQPECDHFTRNLSPPNLAQLSYGVQPYGFILFETWAIKL